MTARERLIEYAMSQIGTAEDPLGSNKQKYGAMLDETDWYLYKEGDREWVHKVNGYDWCTQSVDADFISVFSIDTARKMLFRPKYNNYGAVVKYAFNYFKDAGRGFKKEEYDPQPGDVIYFQNSKGLSHTGIVVDVSSSSVTTVEGNSGKNNWYVATSTYRKTSSYIYGYGVPDYDAVDPEPQHDDGWEKVEDKWYYYKDGKMVKSDWIKYKGSFYYLGTDGAMLTGWQVIDGETYYFYPEGHMASGEWMIDNSGNGLFLDMTGAQTYKRVGRWHSDKRGKWWQDSSGVYPRARTVRINGQDYTFDKDGYVID